ncbi:transposase [Thioclava sp. SK-1]|nr:transposase [Thioclava sp. SK-1]
MTRKREAPENIFRKLQKVEILRGQCVPIADAVRQIDVTPQTYYRWRREFGGMSCNQIKRLKDLEQENSRLRRSVSELTLDKRILTEAAQGNF